MPSRTCAVLFSLDGGWLWAMTLMRSRGVMPAPHIAERWHGRARDLSGRSAVAAEGNHDATRRRLDSLISIRERARPIVKIRRSDPADVR